MGDGPISLGFLIKLITEASIYENDLALGMDQQAVQVHGNAMVFIGRIFLAPEGLRDETEGTAGIDQNAAGFDDVPLHEGILLALMESW